VVKRVLKKLKHSGTLNAPWISPRQVLAGKHLRLEPVSKKHMDALWGTAKYPEIWKWMPQAFLYKKGLVRMFQGLPKLSASGTRFPFAIFDKSSGQCAGSSSYLNMDRANRRLEIGYTWLSPHWQRTHVNTEAKYLLLRHAFEEMGCVRVEFKTDALNKPSRAALKRIGAIEEGTLRKHMVVQDGRIRDSVYFSILDAEWPEIKLNLEEKM
jgi:RimJ/RimL family protein N-acetyltransferase